MLGGVAGFVFGGVAVLGFDWGLTHVAGFSLLPDLALWEHARYWWHAALGDAMGAHYHAWLAALQADGGRLPAIAAVTTASHGKTPRHIETTVRDSSALVGSVSL